MSFAAILKRILGLSWRDRVRDLERRMDKIEGAQMAWQQFAHDAERARR